MNDIENDLRGVLSEHATDAPDSPGLLVGVHARSHRRAVHRRTALAAAAVLAVTGGSMLAGSALHRHPSAARLIQPGASGPSAASAPAGSSAPSRRPDQIFSAFAPGWLPDGATEENTDVQPDMESRHFRIPGTDGGWVVRIDVYSSDDLQVGVTGKAGSGHATTVGGQAALEWQTQAEYDVAFHFGTHRVAMVQVYNEGRTAAQLRQIGQRVAASLHAARVPVHLDFTLGWLPSGVTVGGVSDDAGSLSYRLKPANRPVPAVAAIVGSEPGSTPPFLGSEHASRTGHAVTAVVPGRSVNGHSTMEIHYQGTERALWVGGFGPGDTALKLSTGPGVPTLNDLYRIAESARWVG